MADTAAIVNLMRHAADRLAEEDAGQILPESGFPAAAHRARAVSAAMAMTYAEAILRTVAAVLDESACREATDA